MVCLSDEKELFQVFTVSPVVKVLAFGYAQNPVQFLFNLWLGIGGRGGWTGCNCVGSSQRLEESLYISDGGAPGTTNADAFQLVSFQAVGSPTMKGGLMGGPIATAFGQKPCNLGQGQ